jgi:hypothetical protein
LTVTDAPVDPLADRYGRPQPWRRTAVILGSGVVGLVALAWLAWATFFHASPQVVSVLIGWEAVDTRGVLVTVHVDIDGDPDELRPLCTVRATALDHTVVGEVGFTPEEGLNKVFVRTERPATSVENIGCTTRDQHRPR